MENYTQMFQDSVLNFFKEHNVKTLKLNEKIFIDKQEAYAAIIGLCEEILQKGDIKGNRFHLNNYAKYVEANKVGFALFDKPIRVEMECSPNWSFASTTIVCSYFGFDIETIKQNNKERFQKFMDMIDAIEISAGVEKDTIKVNFAVNDVWSE